MSAGVVLSVYTWTHGKTSLVQGFYPLHLIMCFFHQNVRIELGDKLYRINIMTFAYKLVQTTYTAF